MSQRNLDNDQQTSLPTERDNQQVERTNKGKKSGKKRKKSHRFLVPLIIIVCLVIVALGGVKFARDIVVPVDADNTTKIDVEIPAGTDIGTMGSILENEGIVRSGFAFKLYVRADGSAANIQAGVHSLSPSMTLEEIVEDLQEGAKGANVVSISVAEGLTVDQIGELIEKNTRYSKDDFMDLMNDKAYMAGLVQKYPFLEESYKKEDVRYTLEGYLFPATYEFDDEQDLTVFVEMMLDHMATFVEKYKSDIDASKYSLHDTLSVASLLEKEGMTSEDRRTIAGVFYNRLDINMPIQSDISVLYALNTHKEMVSYEDLEVDSPYNLYKNPGLPPGPLNNPSEDAIEAALHPEESDYIYFYANLKTGEVFYTKDYQQHLAWQKEYEETGKIEGPNRK